MDTPYLSVSEAIAEWNFTMNSHECAELARNEHPGIMKRGDTRFRSSKADRALAHERNMREIIDRQYENARLLNDHEARQIAQAMERAMNDFAAAW